MINFVPYQLQRKYPHMMPKDVEIWERFITTNPTAFDFVSYDVPVGSGAEFDTVVHEDTGSNAKKLYQRKIDVVAKIGDVFYVIELKPGASTSAVGQVKAYVTLFKRDWRVFAVVVPMIITDRLLPEMEFLAKNEGVQIVVA